jgi:hypothetical protein
MNKTIPAILAALAVTAGAQIIAAQPADAATAALASGVYVTPAGRDMGLLPSYTPVARPGTYKTSGRPGKKICSLRAVDMYNDTVANAILGKARSWTITIPATAAVVEISGVCKWTRK